MTWAYYPVAGCGESRSLGSEREGSEAIPSSTPNPIPDTITSGTDLNNDDLFGNQITGTINLPPTDLNLSNSSIDENFPENSLVGTFSTTDPNSGDSFTYQLVSGVGDDDNAAFTIAGDQLLINSYKDFETKSSYSILLQTTDAAGASHSEALTINVNDVPPSLTDLNLSKATSKKSLAMSIPRAGRFIWPLFLDW